MRNLLPLLLAVAACGGGNKQVTPDNPGPIEGDHVEMHNDNAMVPPEKMDEIRKDLDRKQVVVSRCLAEAVDNKELPKNSKGKVTLEIVIAPGGKAQSVKVVNATLESKSLNDCVIGHVKEIEFPQLPQSYETSYTYAFEAV